MLFTQKVSLQYIYRKCKNPDRKSFYFPQTLRFTAESSHPTITVRSKHTHTHTQTEGPSWLSCRVRRGQAEENRRLQGETEGDTLRWSDHSPCLRPTFTSSVCSRCPSPWWWRRLGAAGSRPVGGLIAVGWRGICCSLATNCCWNMIKWPLPANMWSRHGCLPVCLSVSLTVSPLHYTTAWLPAFNPHLSDGLTTAACLSVLQPSCSLCVL